jgi:hypothetical protein
MRPNESGEMMNSWYLENRAMSDKKYFIIAGNRRMEQDLDFTPLPAQVEDAVRRAADDPYVPRRRSNSLAIAITCLLALVFGIALWIGSGAR